MAALIFDTLAFSKKLKLSGFTDLQAETHAEAMAELIEEKIATKQDIGDLKNDIFILQKEMLLLKKDLLISIGSMISGAVILLPAIFKLISLI